MMFLFNYHSLLCTKHHSWVILHVSFLENKPLECTTQTANHTMLISMVMKWICISSNRISHELKAITSVWTIDNLSIQQTVIPCVNSFRIRLFLQFTSPTRKSSLRKKSSKNWSMPLLGTCSKRIINTAQPISRTSSSWSLLLFKSLALFGPASSSLRISLKSSSNKTRKKITNKVFIWTWRLNSLRKNWQASTKTIPLLSSETTNSSRVFLIRINSVLVRLTDSCMPSSNSTVPVSLVTCSQLLRNYSVLTCKCMVSLVVWMIYLCTRIPMLSVSKKLNKRTWMVFKHVLNLPE